MNIITAKTIATRDGCRSVMDWIRRAAIRKGIRLCQELCEDEVVARIDHGRWIADCECKGAEYVDPGEPVFFCLSCLNAAHNGRLRPVRFPPAEVREKIIDGLNPANYHSWNEMEEPYGIQSSTNRRHRRSVDCK